MLNLTAPIVPGVSAAGIQIGERVDLLLAQRCPDRQIELRGVVRLEFGPIHLWVEGERVTQIGVSFGYEGTLAGAIRIGSTIGEVAALLGPVEEDDEDNLVVGALPGWCFETEQWLRDGEPEENADSRIDEIYIFADPAASRDLGSAPGSAGG
jgi:hypothetical protein